MYTVLIFVMFQGLMDIEFKREFEDPYEALDFASNISSWDDAYSMAVTGPDMPGYYFRNQEEALKEYERATGRIA